MIDQPLQTTETQLIRHLDNQWHIDRQQMMKNQ